MSTKIKTIELHVSNYLLFCDIEEYFCCNKITNHQCHFYQIDAAQLQLVNCLLKR